VAGREEVAVDGALATLNLGAIFTPFVLVLKSVCGTVKQAAERLPVVADSGGPAQEV
jgi:hypothetical protein